MLYSISMRAYDPLTTIAAIATPPGEGGVAIIRISGSEALTIAARVFSGDIFSFASHTAHYGKFLREKEVIDTGLALVMRAPRSYTGELTVEFHCHGGSLISQRLLDVVIQAGARAAQPGEFTFRAFMNGKIDLAQAEAVQETISARNELALASAGKQLEGLLSKKIRHFQQALVDIAATLEAWVDFPEEGLEFMTMESLLEELHSLVKEMRHLEATFSQGRFIQQGITLCLAGRPNAGKSSLMNALLGYERAIVTPIAGTTRDTLQEDLRLGQLHFRLSDTAGLRETEESIEQEGIRRTKIAMDEADIVLLVIDAQQATETDELSLIEAADPSRTVVAWNKVDLPHTALPVIEKYATVPVSAKLGWGLTQLQETLQNLIWRQGPPSKEEVLITNIRHKEALSLSCRYLEQLINGLQEGISPEFLSADMRSALKELGTIIGTDITDDILTAIFSKFCIGK